jgi:hypothetical protein
VPAVVSGCHVSPPSSETWYPVIASPPSVFGTAKVSASARFWLMTVSIRGLPGTVAVTTAADGSDSAPSPTELLACTVNVYATPLTSPLTEHGLPGHAWVPAGTPLRYAVTA